MNARRGMSLGSTLLVVTLVVTLGFSLSGLSVSQLSFARKADNRQQAANMAESVIALGIEKVRADEHLAAGTFHIEAGNASGWLTFDHTDPELVASTNNLAGAAPVPGDGGRSVPAGTVRLVGEGRCGGVVRRVEAMLRAPACPYALACTGKIESLGGILVGSVQSSDEVAPILADPVKNPPRPGDLVANADTSDAVRLKGRSTITGDVQTGGEVQADHPGSDIWGEVRAHCDPVDLPEVTIDSYDPATTGKPHTDLDAPPDANPTLSGAVRFATSQVITGTLTLDSALVFVKGDLTVKGGVKGRGALVVTGKTRLEAGAALDAGNRVALLGGGDVTILGSGKQSSAFQGLVYTWGNFHVEQITVVGSLFARGAQVTLGDCNLFANPDMDTFQFGGGEPTGELVVSFDLTSLGNIQWLVGFYNLGLVDEDYVHAHLPQSRLPFKFARAGGTLTASQVEPTLGEWALGAECTVDPDAAGAAESLFDYFDSRMSSRVTVLPDAGLLFQLFRRQVYGPPLVPPTKPFADLLPPPGVQLKLGSTAHHFTKDQASDMLHQILRFVDEGGGDMFVFDPSKFLRFEDRVRVSLWRDL